MSKEDVLRSVAERLAIDTEYLGMSRGERALVLALVDIAKREIREVYSDCGDCSADIAKNVAYAISHRLAPILLNMGVGS